MRRFARAASTCRRATVHDDPDEPLVHVYAEGKTPEEAATLEEEFLKLVEEIVAGTEDEVEVA